MTEITNRRLRTAIIILFQKLTPEYHLKSISNLAIMLLLEVALAQTRDAGASGLTARISRRKRRCRHQQYRQFQLNNSVKGNS